MYAPDKGRVLQKMTGLRIIKSLSHGEGFRVRFHKQQLKVIPLILLLVILLAGCEGLVETVPTPTPTRNIPTLQASPTVDARPPTPLPPEAVLQGNFAGRNNPTAAAAAAESGLLPGETDAPLDRPSLITITAADGRILNGELYSRDETSPGVLIIGSQFESWDGFPVMLRDAGFTVLLVEARIPALAGDFTAMLDNLILQNVDPARLAVIGSQNASETALIGCAGDARCGAVVLLSPIRETPLLGALRDYNPRPILIAASENDPEPYQAANALRLAATGDALFQPFEDAGRGTQILVQRPDMVQLIIDWLARYIG